MICRTCLRQGASIIARRPQPALVSLRTFSTSLPVRNAAAAAAPTPEFSTPTGEDASASAKPALSTCPEGTVLNGLNYFKGKNDPVAKPDDQYPEWLWRCLEVQKKDATEADEEGGDAFSKSKKQRRLYAKRQRQIEAQILASGDISALAPKIPLQQQTINLPGKPDGDVREALYASDKREELRKAMRKERKAKIKEANYLKSM
ncbi:hypothetical protein DL546_001194 [Coniochaeta pulveracea]|uniref:Large ribosomal subunit protein mL54 n=1 Tax=Coniochaeta pulveracea TaxID=177199 RepID=A0A420Y179_9PEZI|nr:hypothetical protein DL546_001194 [Coniochaeta pulveracea]